MKRLFTFLFLFNIAFAQETWVRLQIQLDGWAEESSWTIYNSDGDVAFEMFDDYWDYPNELIDLYMEMDSGNYTFEFADSYGDGFYPSGYVLLTNECQDTLAYAFDLGNDTLNGWTTPGVFDETPAILLKSLTIAPCAPPSTFTYGCVNPVAANYDPLVTSSWMESCEYIYGCTNPNALNFNPIATYDDQSCVFPPPQFDTSNVYQSCNGSQTELTFEYQANGYGPIANVNQVHYGYDLSATPFVQSQYYQAGIPVGSTPPITFPYTIWEVTYFANTLNQIALKAGGNFVTEEIPHFFFVKFDDGTYSDTLWFTPEACIPGCTDNNSPLFNPFANIENGSCQVNSTCNSNEAAIDVIVTPDTYPGETSWQIVDPNSETILYTGPSYNQTGIPVTTTVCVDTSTTIQFELMDVYGDGLCGSCYGGVDGEVLVLNSSCGDTLFHLTPPDMNFGYGIYPNFGTITQCQESSLPSGCTDASYVEYDPLAIIDDGSCVTPVILGCLDSTMFNYDPLANQQLINTGCDYTLRLIDGLGDGWFGSYIGVVQGDSVYGPFTIYNGAQQDFTINLGAVEPAKVYFFTQGNSVTTVNQCGVQLIGPDSTITFEAGASPWTQILEYPYVYNTIQDCGNNCIEKIYGCIDVAALNYNDEANTNDGSCYYIEGCTNPIYLEYNPEADFDNGNCETLIVLGCMDSTALNYNAEANQELEGSCVEVVLGCMNELAFNYNPNANVPDTCIAVVEGCLDETAMNYDSLANVSDNSCVYYVYGCTDPNAFNFDPLANTGDGSCVAIVYGCTDNAMFNYNSAANVENGSCIPFYYGCTDPTMYNYDDDANTDNGSCIPFIYGCTDAEAINYNVLANADDNSCIDPVLGCTDLLAFNYNAFANTDDGSCIDVLYGCIDPTQFNYNPEANTDDGSCIEFLYGCTDPTAFNYCDTCNADNGSCIEIINGCTDTTALNYNVLANTNNGSCIYPLPGCTDPTALNYNVEANVPDSSCYYSAGCNVGDIYTLPNECFSWVIQVDPYCCDDEWDNSCVELYAYCQDGWTGPVSITEFRSGLVTYPNPTSDYIYVNKKVDLKVINMLGDIVISKSNTNVLDVSKLSPGMYNVLIEYNKLKINNKIIKQ